MDQHSKDDQLLRPIRNVVAQYLNTKMSLEVAAAQFAYAWREAATAAGQGSTGSPSFESFRREAALLQALAQVRPAEARKIKELVEAGLATLAMDEKGAA